MAVSLNIVFHDGDALVLNKPSGVQSEGSDDSAEHWARKEIGSKNQFPILMHRLDKPASGLLLFACNKRALKSFQTQMEQRGIRKEYVCIVQGDASNIDNNIRHFLKRDEKGWKSVTTVQNDPDGKEALIMVLNKEYLSHLNQTLLHLQLITGRYHQIRCQLADLGLPIVGDGLYAPSLWNSYKEIALHHGAQEWTHPVSGNRKRCVSIPGSDLFAPFDSTCALWLNSQDPH